MTGITMTTSLSQKTNYWLANRELCSSPRIRLFCFPYSGAGASIFRTWQNSFPPNIEICPVMLPGRESRLREPLYTELPPLVKAVADALAPYFNVPIAFFGHSMGALLSFELARYLRRHFQLQPVHLFISAHSAPHLTRAETSVANLPEADFVTRLREMRGTDEAILACTELREIILPILRADFSVCETYEFLPDEPLDCPITVFGGLDDPYIKRDELDHWKTHTYGSFKLRMLPGNHFFLNGQCKLLIESISRDLFPNGM